MARVFFVDPSDTVKLPLFDDGQHWIEVKRELSGGEARQLAQGPFSRLVQSGDGANKSPAWDLDFEAAAFLKIELYLVDWNIPDKSGKTFDISTPKAKRDALHSLRRVSLSEIERVIDAHVLGQEKNAQSGEPTSNTTSSSVNG